MAPVPQYIFRKADQRQGPASQDLAVLCPLATLQPKPFTIHELRRNLKQLGW